MKVIQTYFNLSVWQDGVKVAAASSSSYQSTLREAMHYAAMYEQDGPVQIKERNRVIYRTPEEEVTP